MCNNVGENYAKRSNFPNCIECIDGKYVEMSYPSRSGSQFYNYKELSSIFLRLLLTAIVDRLLSTYVLWAVEEM
jgi:hypothetical protein